MNGILVTFIVLLHFSATLMMTGIVWFLQCVLYPLFKVLNDKERFDYCSRYISNASDVTVPILLIEVVTGILIVFRMSEEWVWYLNLFLIALTWFATVFYQIPLLLDVKGSGSQAPINSLVRKNMIRTLLWSVRSVILFVYLLYNI